MSWFEDSNIKKSYIVQTVSDVGIFSACTQIYLTNISPCVGDTINITGNLGVSGNISGTTYFGDGSQLSGIVTTDNFVTGGVYSASSETLYFTGTTGFTPFSVDVSALLDNTNNYVTGGTYNSSTDIVTLTRNDNVNINITGVSNTFTTGATYNEGTELITFVRNDGNTYTADLAAIASATTNSFTTGATLNGNIIEFANNLLGLDYYNVDLTSLVSGKLDTTTFNTYSGSVETQLNNKTENTNFTSHTGDTTIHYTKGSINLSDLGSSAHTHSISEVINLQTELDSKVTTTLFNTYTGDTETSLSGKLDTTSFNTYSGSVQTELDSKVESASNVGGANNVFSGKSGTDLQFRTISGGSNTTITTVGGIIKIDSTGGGSTTPTLQEVLSSGNTTSGNDIIMSESDDVVFKYSGWNNRINTQPLTTHRNINFPDNDGTVALVSDTTGYTETTLFNTYTGDTETALNSKLDTTSFNTYSGSVETQLGNKTDNTDFTSHTGDTTIHYTKGSINLSDLGSSAHTHTISEVINLQTELDAKVATTLFNTYTGDTETALGTKLPTTTFNSYTGSVVDVHVSSGNANAGTQQLSFTNTTGGTFNVTNSAALFSDNDVNVTGGTYDINTGCVTFTTNSGTTFDVCGFVTGITDTFVTGGTLTGENLVLERNSGVDVGNIDLSGLVSGKLEISLFNTYTGDTQTALGNKTDNTNFVSHTGDTTIHYTKGSINLSELGSSAHTHSISEVVNLQTELDSKVSTTLFNTYTGDTETVLGTKVSTASNIGGGEGLFSGKSGTDLQFKSLTSTGGTVTISTTGATVNLESAGSGGSSPWVDNGSSIVYSGHGDYVEFKDSYLQIAATNTSNTLGTFSDQVLYLGTGITAAGGAGSVGRTLIAGSNHTIAATSNVIDSIIAGNTNTIGSGTNNLIVGQSLTVDAANNSWIGGNVGNNITSISDSLIFSTGIIKLTDTMVDCVILGNSSFGVKGDTVFGFGDDLYGNSTSNNEVMMLGFNVQLNNPTSKSILIGSGQNDGQYLQIDSNYEKGIYYGVGSSKPWFALTEAQSGVGTGTSGKVGNIFFGVDIADEGGTANVGEGIMWLQESTVNPSANITDAGALYNSGGTITWWDGTTNYGLTSSGGGGGGLNYITSGDTVANNLELTSNWDINGVYTGATATGAQADCHVDSNYWFTCVATDTWIRLIRG